MPTTRAATTHVGTGAPACPEEHGSVGWSASAGFPHFLNHVRKMPAVEVELRSVGQPGAAVPT
jgi:hypothetical protein